MHCAERGGTGIPVVCVHGFCQSSAYWEPTLDRLAESGRAAAAPDLPGFGRSSALPGPYTMEAYADGVAAFLAARGVRRIVLVGGSMGGVVAQHFVLRHPQIVERLLLVATGAFTADPPAALAKAEAMAAHWNDAAADQVVAGFFHQPPSAARLEELRHIARAASQPAAVEATRSNALSRTFERLGEIAVPVLIVQGRYDKARTPEHGEAMVARLKQGRLAVLANSGHTPQLEEPEAFRKLAMPFLLGNADCA
jgi:pimeloyl-ACP methyl ester carboxylesterase